MAELMAQLDSIDQYADSLVQAFGSNRVSDYFDHFAQDATFIFYTHKNIMYSRQDYINLWDRWVRESDFSVISCVTQNRNIQFVGKSTTILTHEVTTVVSVDGAPEELHERETIVFHKDSNGWQAVHEHLSPAVPKPVQE